MHAYYIYTHIYIYMHIYICIYLSLYIVVYAPPPPEPLPHIQHVLSIYTLAFRSNLWNWLVSPPPSQRNGLGPKLKGINLAVGGGRKGVRTGRRGGVPRTLSARPLMHVYVYMYVCNVRVCVHICIHTYKYVCMGAYLSTHLYDMQTIDNGTEN